LQLRKVEKKERKLQIRNKPRKKAEIKEKSLTVYIVQHKHRDQASI